MMYHQQGESPGLHSATPIRNGIGIKFGWKHTFISSATVQERTQRGVQRMVVIRGVENTVNKKKFKCSVHIVLEKVGRRQQSLKKAFPCIIDIIKKRSSIVLMLADLIWPKTNTDYVSGITRVLPAHSNKASISFCRHYWGSSTDQSNLEGKFYISGVTSEAEDHTAPRHPSLPLPCTARTGHRTQHGDAGTPALPSTYQPTQSSPRQSWLPKKGTQVITSSSLYDKGLGMNF